MSRVKLKDIAERAGVSMMTVSRVMTNNAKVGEKTRARIMKIAEDMSYSPNIAARNLASSKSLSVGILCEFANASYVNKFLVGLLRSSRLIGFHMVIDETTGDKKKALDIVNKLLNVTRVNSLILLPPISNDPAIISLLVENKIHFVRIAPDNEFDVSPYICMDDYQAAYDVTLNLIQAGHRHIAHIIGHPDQGVSQLRYQGYLAALRSQNIVPRPEYAEQGYFTYKSGLEAAKKLLELPTIPDAIFAANDEMAAAVISMAHKKHLEVPAQVSVVGFDDTELASSIWPSLTTVQQPISAMAELALEILATDHDKTDRLSNRNILDYKICERESSNKVV